MIWIIHEIIMVKLMVYELVVNDAIVIDGKNLALANQHKVIPVVFCPKKGAQQILEECLTCTLCGSIETRTMECNWTGPEKKADVPAVSEQKQ